MGRVILALLLIIGGCVTRTQSYLWVDLGLDAVQRPSDVAERWGEDKLQPADTSGYTYDDEMLSLAVVPLTGSFSAVLRNKTEHSVRLLWADGAYVGPDGISSGIVSGDTEWRNFGNTPDPQTIPAQAAAALSILPRATADRSSMSIGTFYGSGASCQDVPGTSLRLILPLEVQGVTNEYTLEFTPRYAELVETTQYKTFMETMTEIGHIECEGVPGGS